MKNVILSMLLISTLAAHSQPSVQPIASGDYWQIDEYQNRLPELANKTTFPVTVNFTNGSVGITDLSVNRLDRVNEIIWNTSIAQNASDFVVEWSRDLKTFEQATVIQLKRVGEGNRYVFKHVFEDDQLVYYRIGIVTNAKTIAYSPAVQVADVESNTKIFPTQIKGSTFYVQTANAFEKLQVVNSANIAVYEKGISGQTGTLTIGLPDLPTGIYFIRLLNTAQPQHVQKVLLVE